jgi:hypothetical protein
MNFKNWLESDLGDALYSKKGIWMIPFKDVERDEIEGYYFNWSKHHSGGSISDLSKVNVGDKVADYALNWTAYWIVSGVDEKKGWVYLNPIEPNPMVTGVGAGGKKIDQWDMDVLSGKYETERVNDILATWKSGKAHGKQDVAYLLLGTVPLNFGPNGAQGGWYNTNDIRSNRGGQKGMDAKDIMKRDAEILKGQFGFDIPAKALSGELDTGVWTGFVSGQVDDENLDDTRLEGEDFKSAQACAKMVLTHREPAIKLRNVEKLLDLYANYAKYRADIKKVYKKQDYDYEKMKPELDALEEKWKSGHYTDGSILDLIHRTALKLSKIFVTGQYGDYHDPYWHVKEKLIVFGAQQGWRDVLELYERTLDRDNRWRVYHAYEELKDIPKMLKMLSGEKTAENILRFLQGLKRLKNVS